MSLRAWLDPSRFVVGVLLVFFAAPGLGVVSVAQELAAQEPVSPTAVAAPATVYSQPLHERIDQILAEHADWLTANRGSESQLLRRLSLDLRNVVPTQDELDQFVADPSPDRWSQWVTRFQQDPLASERLVDWYDKTLMQRRPFQYTDRTAWLAMLRATVDASKPLDEVIRNVVSSVWWNGSQRAQQRFFLDRGGDPNAIARDLGRILFGRDMQCAQCHDHPQIDDYLQIDYHGLLAFVSPGTLLEVTTKDDKGADQKLQAYIERAAGDAAFESVFDKGVKFRSATRLPGQREHLEAYVAPDLRYELQPKPEAFAGIGMAPNASRRELLASQIQGSQRAFAENWANRLWALMFGRGLVHPLDMHHSDNPPSNPALLAALTDALIASDFDVPAVLGQIALSNAYQRGRRMHIDDFSDSVSVLNVPNDLQSQWTASLAGQLVDAKQKHDLLDENQQNLLTAMEQSRDAWRVIQQERTALRAELDGAEALFNDANKKVAESQVALDKAVAAESSSVSKIGLLDDASSKLEQAKSGPEDPELQSAIAAVKARVESLRGGLPVLQQAAAAATPARDTTVTARESERAKWQGVVDRLMPIEQRLAAADDAFVAARKAHDQCKSEANLHLRRTAEIERLQQWFEHSANVRMAQTREAESGMKRSQYLLSVEPLRSALTEADLRVAQVQEQVRLHEESVATAASGVAAIEAELQQLESTKVALVSSAKLVEDAANLAAATDAIERASAERSMKLIDAKTAMTGLAQQRVDIKANRIAATAARDASANSWNGAQQELAGYDSEIESLKKQSNQSIEKCAEVRAAISLDRQQQHAAALERPLSPEQLGWSILRSTGVLQSYIANEGAELDKQSPLPSDATVEQRRTRSIQVTRGSMDKLRGNVDIFSNLYASGVGQTSDEFFASPDQALFVANGGSVYAWAGPNGSNVTSQVLQQSDMNLAARQIFWSVLSREPRAEEMQFVAEQLTQAGEQRTAIVQELVWSILASAEYRLYP